MSCNYADGLSEYENKGKCGIPEIFDSEDDVKEKTKILAEMILSSNYVVAHTGAGISTSAGIPDFRGPNGVWTLEKRGEKPTTNTSFEDALPTYTHMALLTMIEQGLVHYVVSQNIDGLHLRSGLPKNKFSELHGNMFLDKCDMCQREFVRNAATKTLGQKYTGESCPARKKNGRSCRGRLRDTILDWEDELPSNQLDLSDEHSRKADLSIALGSTLQIVPSGNLPLLTKKKGGKLVICNLQPTKHDKHADLIIHSYVDDVMKQLAEHLGINVTDYDVTLDPTKNKFCEKIDVCQMHDLLRSKNLVKKEEKFLKNSFMDVEKDKIEPVCVVKMESNAKVESCSEELINVEETFDNKPDRCVENDVRHEDPEFQFDDNVNREKVTSECDTKIDNAAYISGFKRDVIRNDKYIEDERTIKRVKTDGSVNSSLHADVLI